MTRNLFNKENLKNYCFNDRILLKTDSFFLPLLG